MSETTSSSLKIRTILFALAIALGVTGTILSYLFADEVYNAQDTFDGAHLPEVDAIVCLAGGRGRISAAGDLWYRYWEQAQRKGAAHPGVIPVFYLSGMGHQAKWAQLVKLIRPGVLAVLKPENVILEKKSVNTEDNALWLVKSVKQQTWKRVLLVTSRYHIRRAQWIFNQVFQATKTPLKIETYSIFQEPFEPGEWRFGFHGIRVTVLEYYKWLYYRWLWRPGHLIPS